MNPEFQRNLWLELPAHRLVAMPAVLLLVFFGAYMAGGSLSFAGAAQALIAVLLIVWGSRLSAESVLNEIIGHTWDAQRMSAISPWDMTWGKLLGSTAFMWYGAVWCVVAFVASPHGDSGLLVRLLLAGLQGQALALFLSMVLARGEPASLRFQVTIAQSLTVMVLLPFLFITMFHRPGVMHWYGMEPAFDAFVMLSQLAFIGWTVLGLYQNMRAELQYTTGPLTWLFFVVFSVIYVAGFDRLLDMTKGTGMPSPAIGRLFVAFCAAVFLTYVCALVEPKSVVRLRRWVGVLSSGRLSQGGQLAPAWIATGAVSLVLALLTVVNIVGVRSPDAPLPVASLSILAAVLCFAVRDLAVFHFLSLHNRSGRGNLIIGLYMIGAYALLPMLFGSAKLTVLVPALVPTASATPEISVMPVAVEAIIAVVMVVQRWRAVRIEGLDPGAGQGAIGHGAAAHGPVGKGGGHH